MLSIQPKWCEKIASGKKTVEVRKNRPNIGKPFKCYIYCTQKRVNGEILLTREKKVEGRNRGFREQDDIPLAGKVVGEFVCEHITFLGNLSTDPWRNLSGSTHEYCKQLVVNNACLTETELRLYGGKYAWHISDLVIYDKPKELSEFERACPDNVRSCAMCRHSGYSGMKCPKIIKAPQSWCYVEVQE
jgi:predicted transcriptional regulator